MLIILFLLVIIFLGLYIHSFIKNRGLKSENTRLQRLKPLSLILEQSSKEKNIFKALKNINSILLNELQMDYSSFFILHRNNLVLKDSNIIDLDTIQELASIKDFIAEANGERRDFRMVFEEHKYVWLFSEVPLEYPTASRRGIRSSLLVPLMANGEMIGGWLIEDCRKSYVDEIDVERIVPLADQIGALLMTGLYTYQDSLMKIPKKDFFMEFINEHLEQNKQFAVAFADIDHFKGFNDTYGHEVGDFVLQAVAQILEGSLERDEMVARYGGEEIVFCLPELSKEKAAEKINSIREALANTPFEIGEEKVQITASFGVSAYPEDTTETTANQIVKLADTRLYKAKKNGRNCVIAD